jgi:dTMP kinase
MFITLEGIEGSGKTTQIAHIKNHLATCDVNCTVTREPGGTVIGAKIRAVLLDPANHDMDPLAELLLYMADRAQHICRIIQPALDKGHTVLCDRFFDATVVYQGAARGLNCQFIEQLHEMAFGGLKPDLTLLLDLPPELGLKRAWSQIKNGNRVANESRFEEEKLAFHTRVRSGYLALAEKNPKRFRIIDATQNEEQVKGQITNLLDGILAP